MVNTPDLTIDQIKAQCNNSVICNYISSMPDLPKGVTMASLLGTLMQAATVAQNIANYDNKTPGGRGELITYRLEHTGNIEKDMFGRQFFRSVYKLNLKTYINDDHPIRCINQD
ncbi:MAG: hypothetical protein V7L31_23040 [Nostoc sp.]|uniref:hypothetical protein n=1 Tax=Nostoc sp. TaxID=1180 RepID=UPI002FF42E6B